VTGKLKKRLASIAFFGCFGVSTEILFTGIYDFVEGVRNGVYNLAFPGHSYIWMFVIYGLIGIILPASYKHLQKLPLLVRLLIYTFGIYLVEFTSGFLLDQLIGHCPWEYKVDWQVMGYIRLDFFPAWMLFVYVMEKFYRFLSKLGIVE